MYTVICGENIETYNSLEAALIKLLPISNKLQAFHNDEPINIKLYLRQNLKTIYRTHNKEYYPLLILLDYVEFKKNIDKVLPRHPYLYKYLPAEYKTQDLYFQLCINNAEFAKFGDYDISGLIQYNPFLLEYTKNCSPDLGRNLSHFDYSRKLSFKHENCTCNARIKDIIYDMDFSYIHQFKNALECLHNIIIYLHDLGESIHDFIIHFLGKYPIMYAAIMNPNLERHKQFRFRLIKRTGIYEVELAYAMSEYFTFVSDTPMEAIMNHINSREILSDSICRDIVHYRPELLRTKEILNKFIRSPSVDIRDLPTSLQQEIKDLNPIYYYNGA